MNPTACAYLVVLAFAAGFLVSRSLPETSKTEAAPSPEPKHSSPSLETSKAISGDQLRFLASAVLSARLRNKARVLDASDCQEWLLELAEASDQVAA